ncbi:hypothetical protein CARUB_v10021725mg [Capsella rubella]|uniref:MADS-box domain-containing protein n=2 Tax=Capsella rubella TaxID=81985 RepID=R0HWJ2_9BRAS|nr:agamous-like MADS-box protein AGL29 [Capsella rubella]EOA34214.1 hypothetical protein CARUB_v10021725mg [Capsella rubella]
MNTKKSKGKQKINIKKIERSKDRLVTLSKRRNGIYTKLCELSVLCGVHIAFLGYTDSGKPFTFGSPSFQAVAERFLNSDASSSSSLQQSLFTVHHKQNVQELCTLYNNLVEQTRAEEVKAMKAAASMEPFPEDAWWKMHMTKEQDQEEAKKFLDKFEGLYEKLCDEIDVRSQRRDAARNHI